MTRQYTVIQSPEDSRDFIMDEPTTIPQTLNLSNLVSGVKDQGGEGACSAYAASTIKEYHEQKENNLTRITFSPQFIYRHRDTYPNEGMTPRDTFDIMLHIGSLPTKLWSARLQKSKGLTAEVYEKSKDFRIEGYARCYTIEQTKLALNEHGPCYIAIPVYNNSHEPWNQQANQNLLGGHALTIVGYNKEGFILQNSWGTEWNNGGFTTLQYDHWGKIYEAWSFIDAPTAGRYRRNGKLIGKAQREYKKLIRKLLKHHPMCLVI